MLHQLHWQFKDGTTEKKAQRDINSHDEMEKFVEETQESHPLTKDAMWRVCVESENFVMTIEIPQ